MPGYAEIHAEVLGFLEFPQSIPAAFATEPALLRLAEGPRRVGHDAAVDPDHARVDRLGDAQGVLESAGVDVVREAVLRVVRPTKQLGFVVPHDDWRYRPEDLLPKDAGVGAHAGDERRRRVTSSQSMRYGMSTSSSECGMDQA
jgi:hypothetical protein